MFRLRKFPKTAIEICTTLCLSQVKEQLVENLIYFNGNPQSFIYNGQLFAFTNNRSFFADDSLSGNFSSLKFTHSFN
jgi:hypothetical protein